MDAIDYATRNTREVVRLDELKQLISTGGSAYIGFEPSGVPTIATGLLWPRKLADIAQTGLELTILLADWHAMINDKLGGNLERIRASGKLMREVFLVAGLPASVKFLWTSDNVQSSDYWKTLLSVAKAGTLPRIRRALPIMGRTEEDADKDFSKYIYPLMQVTDIIYNGYDLALGGIDQRHAHMLCRDIQDKLKIRKVVAIHTSLVSSLNAGARMDFADSGNIKMSKSDPNSGIFIFDDAETVRKKISRAFCPPGTIENNPLTDIARLILIPYSDTFRVIPSGGSTLEFSSVEDFESSYRDGKIHPSDLKDAVSEALIEMMKPFTALKNRSGKLMDQIAGRTA